MAIAVALPMPLPPPVIQMMLEVCMGEMIGPAVRRVQVEACRRSSRAERPDASPHSVPLSCTTSLEIRTCSPRRARRCPHARTAGNGGPIVVHFNVASDATAAVLEHAARPTAAIAYPPLASSAFSRSDSPVLSAARNQSAI
jgi:hypothetical protein